MSRHRPGLYVVATPIGNLGDLSRRALQILSEARILAAEDTRVSRTLLPEGAAPKLISLTEYNVAERAPELLEAAREAIVLLVSDAGTPVIADPGGRLVELAHAAGVPVFTIPGPSALVAAVSVSGFPGDDVHFLGFLPRALGERKTRLLNAAAGANVLAFFESPNRLSDTLAELVALLGDPEVAVCRELTKLHEETVRGHASDLAVRFKATRGECTVVVRSPEPQPAEERAVADYVAEMKRAGARRPGAAAEAARRFNIPRDRAYALWDEVE